MKRIQILALSIVMVLLLSHAAFAQSAWTGNINFFLGGKSLKESDWEPLEDQNEFGIEINLAKINWPVNIAIDIMHSSDKENILGIDVEGSTNEYNIGVRKIFDVNDKMHPFIGGGLSVIEAEIELVGYGSIDGDGPGYWLAGGVYWTLGGGFNLGIELKHTDAEATITLVDHDIHVEAGGDHFGLILGYHW